MNILIIIPCYNEEHRLPVDEFLRFSLSNPDISFLFVNDGSTDNTVDLLKKMEAIRDNIFILHNQINQGKAETIRCAAIYALERFDFKYLGFFDADLATPLFEINNLEKLISQSDYLMITCSRIRRLGAEIDRNFSRYFFGRVFATFASRILILPVYDTQCGAKIIKKSVVKNLFNAPFVSKWFFDIELFARIITNFGYNKSVNCILEYPMQQWKEVHGSKIKFIDFLKTPIELVRLNCEYHKKIRQQIKKEQS